MSTSVSQISAEIARLVAENADPSLIAGARERRAVAERAQRRRDVAVLVGRLDRSRTGRHGARLSPEELGLLLDELYLLRGRQVLASAGASA